MIDLERMTAVATDAARAAGALLMEGFGLPVGFASKSRRDFVTRKDGEAERLILERLRAAFPDHGILAEESGETPGAGEYRWIVDPLSSTRNYIHGVPHWAVCIAAERLGTPVVAVVLDPFVEELYTAQAGSGAYRNGARITVSRVPSLDRAMMCASFSVEGEDSEKSISQGLTYYSRLVRSADLRSFGSSGLHLAFVAGGRFEAFISNAPDPFTAVAGALLVREAGGVVTDFHGAEWTVGSVSLAASNGRFHDALLRAVRCE